jgi:Caspase domain
LTPPRIALVIGNSKYPDSPLTNPFNDANAMGKELKALGFDTQVLLDSNLKDLGSAIQAYSGRIAKSKAVGLFYYAGHGVQLAWRNYLVPIDAEIDRIDDIPKKTFELNALLNALTKAQNSMNIIILDACRDNPFGKKLPIEQKGLSQFDAPANSLLCYSTAPGNVASDGSGKNGLFTENLLREMRNPDSKIEDVMKRVRLEVRRTSQGAQIPWESTSLVDDFYFTPSNFDKRKSELVESQEYLEQKRGWDRIKDSKNVDEFYAFLNKYPSGFITEQATFQIEQLQKAQITVQANKNGEVQKYGEKRFRVGDIFTGRMFNGLTGELIFNTYNKVEKIENGLAYINNKTGRYAIRTLDGGLVRVGSGVDGMILYDPPRVDMPGDILEVGKRWVTRSTGIYEESKKTFDQQATVEIVSYEQIEVPLGNFWAYKIMLVANTFKRTFWAQPGWGVELKSVTEWFNKPRKDVFELATRSRGEEIS